MKQIPMIEIIKKEVKIIVSMKLICTIEKENKEIKKIYKDRHSLKMLK